MNSIKLLDDIAVPYGNCDYWDVRIESTSQTTIKYEDYELLTCTTNPSLGAFIRIYQKGMWFYSSTTDLSNLGKQIADLSILAGNISKERKASDLKPFNQVATVERLIRFEETRLDKVSLMGKKSLCEKYFNQTKQFESLKNVRFSYTDEYKVKHFCSSTGVKFSYDFNQCGLAISYSVIEADKRFDDRIQFYGSNILDLDHKQESICQTIQESQLFVHAKAIEAGAYPVIMDSEVVGVFAHESFGHKSEADFMLGDAEAKENWKIGSRVGSDCLSIVDYGEAIGTSGYCPIDDEGFKTQKTYLIKNGILTGRLHSQQTSVVLQEAPTGNARAMNFEFEPIVRMTNTYIEPGDQTFEELLAKVKLGVYVKDMNHGSGLSTFTIAPRKCYMIRDGKIAEPVRVSVISGTVFETLNLIDGCSQGLNIMSSAFGGCGKMEQSPLPVGFGGSKVLVSKMVIG